MNVLLYIAGVALFIIFAGMQLVAGFAGIEEWAGAFWAWAALFVAFAFRFTAPISIGAFFGAMNVWGWHWAVALVFALPGLLFMVPGLLVATFSTLRR